MVSATAGWLECRYVDSGGTCRPQCCRATPGRTRLRCPDPAVVAGRVSISHHHIDQGSGAAGEVISASGRAAAAASTGPKDVCGEGLRAATRRRGSRRPSPGRLARSFGGHQIASRQPCARVNSAGADRVKVDIGFRSMARVALPRAGSPTKDHAHRDGLDRLGLPW